MRLHVARSRTALLSVQELVAFAVIITLLAVVSLLMQPFVKPFGWLGNYEGFRIVQSSVVKPSTPLAAQKTVLAPADIAVRCKLYWSPAFCLLVPDRLVFGQLVRAAAELITVCPIIAGR